MHGYAHILMWFCVDMLKLLYTSLGCSLFRSPLMACGDRGVRRGDDQRVISLHGCWRTALSLYALCVPYMCCTTVVSRVPLIKCLGPELCGQYLKKKRFYEELVVFVFQLQMSTPISGSKNHCKGWYLKNNLVNILQPREAYECYLKIIRRDVQNINHTHR